MSRRTILVVEDNDQNLYLMRFLLQARGLAVAEARDGPAGIEAALRLRPDAILLDIQLPGMTGYEVCERLRALGETARTPIVAVTSYAMPGDRERAFAAGVDGYIEKPINPETFVEQVLAHLKE